MKLIDSHAHLGPMPAAHMSVDADGLVAEERRQIAYGNALRVYGERLAV